MRLIRRPGPEARATLTGCVATIGVFDGVHLGHQRIVGRVLEQARQTGLPPLVFTFEPTPQEVLSKGVPPARLMRLREKAEALQALGVDWLYCPPFDRRMEALEPEAFIREVLVDTLSVRHLVVGDDFRFAHARRGSVADLEAGGRQYGFGVEQVASVVLGGQRVSSTAIRTALAAGDLDAAARLLGRPYRMCGRVVAGQRLGARLGFPTANVQLHRRRSPLSGIFAVRVGGVEPVPLDGVANIGTRPTVDGVIPLLEVHLFGFSGRLYGRHIQVDFIAKLREEVRFPDLESLRAQMEADAREARARLARC